MRNRLQGPVRFVMLALACWATGVSPARAQGRPEPEGVRWSLGVGVLSSPRPYVGAENQTRVIPVLDVESKRFYFRGIQGGFHWVEGERFSLDVVARARFGGFDAGDSSFLAGMEARRTTMEAGLAAAWDLGDFKLEASALADALGRGAGAQVGLELSWPKVFGRGRGAVVPSLGVVWQDADFVDYYAGVRPFEARPERPAFAGRSALNVGAGMNAFVRLTERTRLVALLRAERVASEYEESPIIDSRWGSFGLVALAYQF